MGVKTTTGIASGLDTASIVSQLMAVEKAPLTRLQSQLSTVESQISAMGKVKSAIASLQDAASAIATSSDLYTYTGSVADTSIASASTTSSAVAGTYSLEVDQLATNHKLKSSASIDTSSGGTLTIQLGSTASGSFVEKSGTSAVSVNVAANASLSDIASSINSANAGVTATVISGSDGNHLVVTSSESGETNQIKIDSTISGLGFDPDNTSSSENMSQVTAAQNAIVKIDGITIANTTSNTITDAVTGVTLTLKGTTGSGSTTQLTVANDSSGLETKAKAFVDAYNSARSTLKTLSQYDSTGSSTGVLNGDSTVATALNQLRSLLSTSPSGVSSSYQYLSQLGISSSNDGTLSLDTSTLETAMTSDFASVAKSVAAYGDAFNTLTTNMTNTDGLISNRISGLSTTSTNLNDRIDAMTRLLKTVQARYEAQFTALETLLSSLQTTSTYLTQQLSSLSKSSSS
ncbi:flagellar filament capping protein FliD [Propionivibrio dicarboxylicus]|uniref:Flagellar hook-associated protein 2 n=1 Tax=Propionivibrio dicarboxylicus TaxID=83767 RepID=A0A1G8HBD2_9RHOO|nr:flagellar filament capping protein FliD [Propionivibrio dicarboxylicus]SDI03943.1 flagellar hook-associated protein 2 [Propionivibrio dicarboxylicus]